MTALKTLALSFVVMLLAVVPPLGTGVAVYLRAPGLRFLYLGLFWILMSAYLLLFGRGIRRGRYIADVAFAVPVGHVFAVVALTVAEVIQLGGFAGFHGALTRDGIFDFLVTQLAFPTLLCGWLLLAVAVVAMRAFRTRVFGDSSAATGEGAGAGGGAR